MNKHYKIFSISILFSFFLCLKLSSQAFAASVFLPEYIDKFGVSSHFGDGLANRDNCSGYPLSVCPLHAQCSKCLFGSKYKITGCETDYKPSENTCITKSCPEINAAYKDNVPVNQICTITETSVRTCYISCKNIDFSGYPLDTCPSGAVCTPHPDCGTTTATEGNCSPVKQTVSSCASSTQKPNADGTACIDKDDTCPADYFKSCATGTQGSPKYTERGTACYQCKPACGTGYIYDATNCRDPKILAGTECGGKYDTCLNAPQYLYSDLSISDTLYSNKTVIGIVFDETKKLAIALKTTTANWSTEAFDIPGLTNIVSASEALNDWQGKANTTTVWNYCKSNSKSCPAFKYVVEYKTEGTSAGDWYLPAMGELNEIYGNKAVLNGALSKVDGTQLPGDYHSHWSSSEGSGGSVWFQSFYNGSFTTNYYYNDNNYYVRPVINYGDVKLQCPILYSDMTTAKKIIPGKTPIGVVFDEAKKLAIALNTAARYWSTEYFDVPGLTNITSESAATADWAGKANTTTVWNYCKANSKGCPAFKYVVEYKTEGTSAGDWYLPAMGELNAIHGNKYLLNNSLSRAGGIQLLNSVHWASSEGSRNNAWSQLFGYGGIGSNLKTYDTIYVRPIINYGDIKLQCPILYSDMTTAKEIIPGKTPIGVVFDEAKKLAIALNTAARYWSVELFDVPGLTNITSKSAAIADWAGKANTTTVWNYCKSNSKSCPAFEYVSTYKTEGTSAGDWYLPAMGELNNIYTNKDALNRSLYVVGGALLTIEFQWSSTENDSTYVKYQNFNTGGIFSSSKNHSEYVRPVIKY